MPIVLDVLYFTRQKMDSDYSMNIGSESASLNSWPRRKTTCVKNFPQARFGPLHMYVFRIVLLRLIPSDK